PVRTRGENLAARLVSGGRSPAGPWCGACRQHLAQRPWETVEVTVPAGHDLAVAGLGWVSVRTGPVRLALQLPAGVWYRVRPNLVGRKEASGQGAGPQGLGAAGFGRPAPKHGRT